MSLSTKGSGAAFGSCFESIELVLLLQKVVLWLLEVVELARDEGPREKEHVPGGNDEIGRHGNHGEAWRLGAIKGVDELDDLEREAKPADHDSPDEDLPTEPLAPGS